MGTSVIPYRVYPDEKGGARFAVYTMVQLAPLTRVSRAARGFEALIDSGATRCVFNADIALQFGLDLESGWHEVGQGIGGPQDIWIHEVALLVPGGPVRIHAGFQQNLPVAGLLGMNGFFEHFTVTFDGAEKVCRLQRLYRV